MRIRLTTDGATTQTHHGFAAGPISHELSASVNEEAPPCEPGPVLRVPQSRPLIMVRGVLNTVEVTRCPLLRLPLSLVSAVERSGARFEHRPMAHASQLVALSVLVGFG